jgi:hypothetical protein
LHSVERLAALHNAKFKKKHTTNEAAKQPTTWSTGAEASEALHLVSFSSSGRCDGRDEKKRWLKHLYGWALQRRRTCVCPHLTNRTTKRKKLRPKNDWCDFISILLGGKFLNKREGAFGIDACMEVPLALDLVAPIQVHEDDETDFSLFFSPFAAPEELKSNMPHLILDAHYESEFPIFCTKDNIPVVFILDICKIKMQELGMCQTCIDNPQKCKRLASDIAKAFPDHCIQLCLPNGWGSSVKKSRQYAPWATTFRNVSQRRLSWLMTLQFAQVWLQEHACKALGVRRRKCHKNQARVNPCTKTLKRTRSASGEN